MNQKQKLSTAAIILLVGINIGGFLRSVVAPAIGHEKTTGTAEKAVAATVHLSLPTPKRSTAASYATSQSSAPAPAPQPVPDTINPGDLVQISVSNLTPELAKKCQTTYYPRKGVFFQPSISWTGEMTILFQAKEPGTYLVGIFSPNDDGTVEKAEVEMTVGTGPTPVPTPPTPPVPTPTPTPTPPTPTPVSGPAVAVIGVVGLDGGPRNPIWKDAAVVSAMQSHAGDCYTYSAGDVNDPKTPDTELRWIGRGYASAGADLSAGYVFVVDASGNVLWEGKPTTATALLAVVTPLLGSGQSRLGAAGVPKSSQSQYKQQPEWARECGPNGCRLVPKIVKPQAATESQTESSAEEN